MSNNTVNGKSLVYLYEKSDLNIDNAGQIILVNCENITIKNQEISGTSTAIQLVETHHCTIGDNQILNSYNGIYLTSSENNQIINNTIESIKENGISFYGHSNKNMITENTIKETRNGVSFSYKCNNNTISGNYISDSRRGISLGSYCHNNIISENILNRNFYGIGISWFANHTTVVRNVIGSNDWYGIYIRDSSNNSISQNNFYYNKKHAFFLNALDNNWDGNYWSGKKFKFLPKLIFGRMSINYEGPFHDYCWPWIPWINFDHQPARKPYDIP